MELNHKDTYLNCFRMKINRATDVDDYSSASVYQLIQCFVSAGLAAIKSMIDSTGLKDVESSLITPHNNNKKLHKAYLKACVAYPYAFYPSDYHVCMYTVVASLQLI